MPNSTVIRTIVLDGLGPLEPSEEGKQWKVDPESLCVRVAKDGKTIVVLEAENYANGERRRCRVTAFDFKTGKVKFELKGHNAFVSSISLSPDSRLIATGSGNERYGGQGCGQVKLWDMVSGELVRTLIDQGLNVHSLAFDGKGDHLAIGREVGEPLRFPEVGLWSTATGAMLYNLQLPSLAGYPNTLDQPHSLAFTPDDKLLAVGGHSQLSLWEMPSGKFRVINGVQGPVSSLRFSDDGRKLYLRNVHLNVAELAPLGRHRNPRLSLETFESSELGHGSGEIAVFKERRWIACCPPPWNMKCGEISLWDIESKKMLNVIYHEGVESIDFTPSGQLVTLSIRSESNTTTVLDLKTGGELVRLGHFGPAIFSPTGEVFATLKNVPRSVQMIRNRLGDVEIKRIPPVVGSFKGIQLWETRTGRKLAELPDDDYPHFSPDGKIIASFGSGKTNLRQISHLIPNSSR